MENKISSRNPALDVIRCFALVCVMTVHSFLNNGFYYWPVEGPRMYMMVLMRTSATICVPLFLMLSGYLLGGRRPEKAYYKKLIKTLAIYAMASVLCMVFVRIFRPQEFDLREQLAAYWGFSGGYGWYIEMYMGLFLLIPFLNLSYDHLPDQKAKKLLLLILFCMTSLPLAANIYPFGGEDYTKLLPDRWTAIYPMTYYFLGRYLREYPLKLRKITNLVLIAVAVLVSGTYNFCRSYGGLYIMGPWQDNGSPLILIPAVLVFNFLAGLDCSRMGERTAGVLAKLSDWTLGAYLVSYIFDGLVYPWVVEKVPVMPQRLEYCVLTVPVVFVCSMALSALLNGIYGLFQRRKV